MINAAGSKPGQDRARLSKLTKDFSFRARQATTAVRERTKWYVTEQTEEAGAARSEKGESERESEKLRAKKSAQ